MTCPHRHCSRWLRQMGDLIPAPWIEGFTTRHHGLADDVVLVTRDCWQVKCRDCLDQWYEEITDDAA